MAQISAKLRSLEGGRLAFWCPGCRQMHQVSVGEGPGPRWGFNGNVDAPTFTPSVRVTGVMPPTDEQRARIMRGEEIEPRPFTCHTFITDGRIQFLGDCTHELAGQTVELPGLPGDRS